MKNRLLYVICLIFILLWGIIIFPLCRGHGGRAGPIEGYKDKRVTVSGLISKLETKSYGEYYIYLNSVTSIKEVMDGESAVNNPQFGIICITKDEGTYEKLKCGFSIEATGVLTLFEKATNPGQFDVKDYYASLGIDGRIKNASIRVKDSGVSLESLLYDFKCAIKGKIEAIYPEKEGGIITAILLGDKEGLPKEIKEKYTESGIVHILAISSLHISLIGFGIQKLLGRLGVNRKVAAGLSSVFLILYLWAIDGSISARRSVVMFTLHMIAVMIGRTYDVRTALTLSGVMAVIGEPEVVLNSGFWLSYGCVLSVCTIRGFEGCKWLKPFEAGLKIFAGTLPILLWFYYEVSFWGLLLNAVAIPLAGVLVAGGLVGLLIPLWLKPLGFIVSRLVCLFLFLIEGLCDLTGLTGIGTVIIGKPHPVLIILYYLMLFVFSYPEKIPILTGITKRKGAVAFGVALVAILCLSGNHRAKVTFLDVGQGDGIIIQSGREVLLIDGGSSSKMNVGEKVMLPFLKHEGVRSVDYALLSHPDADHVNGTMELLSGSEIRFKEICISECLLDEWKEKYPNLFEIGERRKSKITKISYGYRIRDGDTLITCIYPRNDTCVMDANDGSEAFILEHGSLSFLFTGDLGEEGEKQLMKVLNVSGKFKGVTYLKVAHHGSVYSSCEEFLDYVRPKAAVISVGKNNYGHPGKTVLKRLSVRGVPYWRTDFSGAFEVFLK
ncbi:MAG: DNA internalization-related competence protein ComEC/Rec2 [Lachnospiraceae bacterium]|nr:DNA internalization-related competence protein ComEC/Rec2 [Lachnospiraceae bacterium]